jgi:putative two-component system response regulator
MALILVVDDNAQSRYLLTVLLGSVGHRVIEAEDGARGLEIARRDSPALVITDVLMPVMDGFELCYRLRRNPQLRGTPLLVYTANFTGENERQFAGLLGCNLYLEKPAESQQLLDAVESLLGSGAAPPEALSSEAFWSRHRSIVLHKLQDNVDHLEAANADLRANAVRLQRAQNATVATIDRITVYRDPYTAGHEHRVGLMAAEMGREMGLEPDRIEGLLQGGFLHDVGKLFAPAEILARTGPLSPLEFDLVKAHSRAGYDILHDLDFPWPVAQIALQHHERMDGSGYPDGLRGSEIMLEARIIAVADVVEAMVSHRPYRPALGVDAALAEIESGAGLRYDAAAAQACLRMFREKAYQLPS